VQGLRGAALTSPAALSRRPTHADRRPREGLRRLTDSEGRDAHPSWSPDGKWVFFSSDRGGHRDEVLLSGVAGQSAGDIYAVRPDGSDLRRLTNDQWEEATPAAVPPGRR